MSKGPLKLVLSIEDNSGDARLLQEMLNEQVPVEFSLTHVTCMKEAEEHLVSSAVDIILLDLGLPDARGLEAVRRIHTAAPRIPLVALTGLNDAWLATKALREGAQDYLIKGQIDSRALLRSLRYAIERKSMEEELFVEKERAQVTLNSIGDGVACADIPGNTTFLNPMAEKITGWTHHEAVGRPMGEVLLIRNAAHSVTIPDLIKIALSQNQIVHLPLQCLLIRRDGTEIAIEDSISPIHDREGQASGAVIVFRDVSASRAMALQMTHSAQHDCLTGLPNGMLLNDRLRQAIALGRRHRKKVALLFLDLDGFQHINNSLGHPIGDKLLQSIAKRLVNCVRGSDTVSRKGGDEFVVLLSEMEQSEDAAITASRMLRAVADVHRIGQHDLHVSATIGVSGYPDDGLDAETLMKNADTAMHQAKQNGRHGYQFFEPAMNVRAVERQFIEASLRRALERQELTVHYQPKINLQTGEITGAEALIRWTHPTRGPVPPAQFVPVAEECGLILPIGNWVLREACKQARLWADAGLPLTTMAVNISAMEFRNEGFLEGYL